MWIELKITLPDALKEPVTAVLYGHGCQGITEGDGSLTAYFPEDAGAGSAADALNGFDGVTSEKKDVPEQDWYAPFKATIAPLSVEGFLICPPWRRCEPGERERLLVLDPGQAFGTGEHATTRTMLRMLREWAGGRRRLPQDRLLDVGTGTGILSVAACLLGVRDVTALDNDPRAIETAARNFELNDLAGRIRLVSGNIEDAGPGYDFIAANIFLEALLDVVPAAAFSLNPGGVMAVSGLVSGQEQRVIKLAKRSGLRVVEIVPVEGWVSVLFGF